MMAALYPLGIVALIAWLFASDDGRDMRTAVALLLNWLAAMAIVSWAGPASWHWFIALDAVTAYVVMRQPAGMVQAIVGALLINQILWHCAFGLEGNPQAPNLYILGLNLAGWLQVATLVGGAIHDSRGKGRLRGGRARSGVASAADGGRSLAEGP